MLYGGALMLEKLFGWDLWFAIISLGVVAGTWAIYGGLRSVAWTDFVTLLVMIVGGLMVTLYGLDYLSGDSHSLTEGWRVMIDRNQAHSGVWREAVEKNAWQIARVEEYNRLSVIQPPTHEVMPWPGLALGWISVGIWYSVINQFMIQRVLGARNMYHARMGIVLAGYLKILMPVLVVVPGLILFALQPEVMLLPWEEIRPAADRGYVTMVQAMIPVGLRGLFLAALFGAIQSTVNSVINSTATVFTWDLYRRFVPAERVRPPLRACRGSRRRIFIMAVSIVLGRYIEEFGGSLFVYIQTLYAFFAPPFAAVFVLGLLSKRVNAKGATAAVFSGFAFGIAMKLYVQLLPGHLPWVEPYAMQALINWCFCVMICVLISALTAPPAAGQVTDQLTFRWSKLNIGAELGHRWYNSVVVWWAVFVGIVICLMIVVFGTVSVSPEAITTEETGCCLRARNFLQAAATGFVFSKTARGAPPQPWVKKGRILEPGFARHIVEPTAFGAQRHTTAKRPPADVFLDAPPEWRGAVQLYLCRGGLYQRPPRLDGGWKRAHARGVSDGEHQRQGPQFPLGSSTRGGRLADVLRGLGIVGSTGDAFQQDFARHQP